MSGSDGVLSPFSYVIYIFVSMNLQANYFGQWTLYGSKYTWIEKKLKQLLANSDMHVFLRKSLTKENF